MSVSRACRPCRKAKIKCDLRRPTCGACSRRGISSCEFQTSDLDFVFRDQNETARVNSERARRKYEPSQFHTTTFTVGSATHSSPQRDDTALILSKALPWLNVPVYTTIWGPPTFTLREKARNIFYSEWILHASNHDCDGTSGYLDVLPVMQAQTATSNPALRLAADAFALANISKFTINDGNLKDMARTSYCQALAAVRTCIDDENSLEADDSVLFAILIIDMFEVAFMNREDPLGLHIRVIEHILTARMERNISSYEPFSLYRLAHHRLQSRQLMKGQDLLPVQRECIKFLNLADPAIDLGAILLRAQEMLSFSQRQSNVGNVDPRHAEEHALTVIQQIKISLTELEAWLDRIPSSWRPQHLQISEHDDIRLLLDRASLPLISRVRRYYDPWVAYQNNFYLLGQLVLRSALLDTLAGIMQTTFDIDRSVELQHEFVSQELGMAEHSEAIIESIPLLIASSVEQALHLDVFQKKKIGQCFAQAACWTLQQIQHVPPDHRAFADQALAWLHQQTSLG